MPGTTPGADQILEPNSSMRGIRQDSKVMSRPKMIKKMPVQASALVGCWAVSGVSSATVVPVLSIMSPNKLPLQ